MEHLTAEDLARILDEAPSPEERGHLGRCRRCRDELDAFRAQTIALSHLPDPRLRAGDWERLEPRLRTEGLLRSRPTAQRGRGGTATPWIRIAAGLLLLLAGAGGGTVFGLSLAHERGDPGPSIAAGTDEQSALLARLDLREDELTLEAAGELVRLTESWYLEALLRYRERASAPGSATPEEDPLMRFAALETLMAAGHAAVRELPSDPFLNGMLVNMRAEREATLRGIQASTTRDWY